MSDATGWTWMEGRTVPALRGGGYIARIYRPMVTRNEKPPHPAAVLVARQWEIEGYGPTPEDAIAHLRRKVDGIPA